jgi:hypothetical protein
VDANKKRTKDEFSHRWLPLAARKQPKLTAKSIGSLQELPNEELWLLPIGETVHKRHPPTRRALTA